MWKREKKKKNKVSNSQKWMEFHRATWCSFRNCLLFLSILRFIQKRNYKTWRYIWHFEIWPQLNFRTIFQLSPKLPFHSPLYWLSVCVYLFSFSKKCFFLFYKFYTSIICTKRPQKASEKRPEMEWKKFGEWRNANGMFLSFLPSNFSHVGNIDCIMCMRYI